ncbi:bifunctional DNA-formamidopyrimidine glycosylase/DNA-(apurinic or apyrimidinic site) lyase [Candidatus Saccharibacteria bacterium]|nr:bifunctional DNA-formamidopyrimidine glycosylase/DNA-(apurinic or apyrimidinic site) lyase [Candidatus Saccharibacteria bacterium]
MPELPEVETVRRGLKKFILKQKLQKVEVLCEKSFVGESDLVVRAKVQDIRRFGKALVIDFDNLYSLLIHLRMTGQLIYDGKERYAAGHPSENFVAELPNGQTRVVLTFDKGTLYFNDQRKFGFIKVLDTFDVEKEEFIEKLAREPWKMSGDEFFEKLQRHKDASIKAVILDQKVICGLGNIYADEALWMAEIHPKRKAGSLSRGEAMSLLGAACAVMEKSIELGGSTIRNYVKADGTRGNYLDSFARVYHRDGEACARCGGTIEKIKVAGRGTHYCPVCQK